MNEQHHMNSYYDRYGGPWQDKCACGASWPCPHGPSGYHVVIYGVAPEPYGFNVPSDSTMALWTPVQLSEMLWCGAYSIEIYRPDGRLLAVSCSKGCGHEVLPPTN